MLSFLPYIILFLFLVAFGIIRGYRKYKTLSKEDDKLPLKRTWIPVEVCFDHCEIKSNEYYEEQEKESFSSRIEMLDSFSSRSSHRVKKHVSVVIYKVNGKTYKSDPVYFSADQLKIFLSDKQTSSIYINPNDENLYYFDLDFL